MPAELHRPHVNPPEMEAPGINAQVCAVMARPIRWAIVHSLLSSPDPVKMGKVVQDVRRFREKDQIMAFFSIRVHRHLKALIQAGMVQRSSYGHYAIQDAGIGEAMRSMMAALNRYPGAKSAPLEVFAKETEGPMRQPKIRSVDGGPLAPPVPASAEFQSGGAGDFTDQQDADWKAEDAARQAKWREREVESERFWEWFRGQEQAPKESLIGVPSLMLETHRLVARVLLARGRLVLSELVGMSKDEMQREVDCRIRAVYQEDEAGE